MAVDKLVDSTQLNADLTSVANAIRTKGGTSAQLAFPADFVSAIQAISTGGGGLKYDSGTFTLANDITIASPYAIPHNLGEVPDVVMVIPVGSQSGDPSRGYLFLDKPMGEELQRTSSTGTSSYPIYDQYTVSEWSPLKTNLSVPSSSSYCISSGSKPTSTHFYLFKYASSSVFVAGTYKYFVSKKWW